MRLAICLVLLVGLGPLSVATSARAIETGKPLVPAEPAPLSLTASDGSGLRLVALQARGVVQEPLAFTELHLTFRNPEPRQVEGQFVITLPPGATISRFAMRQGGVWQEGEVVELQAAQRAYEDFLHRRQDPALLEKNAGNQFRARVFPIPPSADKEIILSYSQELTQVQEPYRIFLRGLPVLDQLDIRVFLARPTRAPAATSLGGTVINREVLEVQKQQFTPDRDFTAPVPRGDDDGRVGLRHDNLAVGRILPVVEKVAQPMPSLLVLFDSSASRGLGFFAQLTRLRAVLKELAPLAGAQLWLKVACFDQEVAEVYNGPLSAFGPAAERTIRERRALGASDLGKALRWAAAQRERTFARVLLFSDGVATAGDVQGDKLREAARALSGAGVQRLDAMVAGGIRDEALLRQLVTAGLPQAGVVIGEDVPTATVAQRLLRATFSGLTVEVPGSRWVWPQQLDGLQEGDAVLVYADLPANQPFNVVVRGTATRTHAVQLSPAERPLVERAWVNARIQRLLHQRDTMAARDEDLRDGLKKQIIDLSTRFRVLCDFTALLVLETEADYQRFHIDRRALTDILTIGPSGLEVQNRRSAPPSVLPLSPEPASPPQALPEQTAALAADPGRPPAPDAKVAARSAPPTPPPVMKVPPAPTAAPLPTQPAPAGGDSDHDGIADQNDKCPYEPGPAESEGCPPPRRYIMVRQARLEILNKVYFRPNDSRLLPVTYPILNEVASVMVARPELRVTIQGHTDLGLDGRGRVAKNLQICRERAASVKAYLAEKGVAASRLFTEAYGPLRPVCTEHTEECWERNRRVEFTLVPEGAAAPTPQSDAQLSNWRPEVPPAPGSGRQQGSEPRQGEVQQTEISPYTGKFQELMKLLKQRQSAPALALALRWQEEEPGDVIALCGLGEALEASGQKAQAARAYGSLIDLYPSRADLRRFAGERLERLGQVGATLAVDTFRKAQAQRPDHPASHRLLAYALLRLGQPAAALDAAIAGVQTQYPDGRFLGVPEILREDVGLIAAAWLRSEPQRREEILQRLRALDIAIPSEPSLRFVLNWETDANDVDFHILDARGGHAFYSSPKLPSGGRLYADVTTGYGPECFTIPGKPAAYPYKLQAHYYSRGPMGYGMGKLEVVEHDGKGGLRFSERPFLIMVDQSYVDLGTVRGPLDSH